MWLARVARAGGILAVVAVFTMLAAGPASAAGDSAPGKAASPAAAGQEEAKAGGVAGLVADWLERTAREYQIHIVEPLSVAVPAQANGLDRGLAAVVRWALGWVEGWVGTGRPVDALAVADVARADGVPQQLADAREEVLEQKRKEEAALKARDAERKAELARRHQENERRIADRLRQLDEAHKRAEEKKRQDAERVREEEARKAADKRAALEAEEQSRIVAEARASEAIALLVQPPAEQVPEVVAAPVAAAVPPVRADILPALKLPAGALSAREDSATVEAATSETIAPVRQAALDEVAPVLDAEQAVGTKANQTAKARKSVSKRSKAQRCASKGECLARNGRRLYVVRAGDTLSAIAARHLGSRDRYSAIFRANRHKIRNPNVILPGQRLFLPIGEG